MMSILYFTYSTACSPTRSSVCHCVNHSVLQCYIILLYNGINNYYIHCYKNVFAHKCYYYAYDSLSPFQFRVYKWACVIKFQVAPINNEYHIRDQIFVVVETLFFHSISRYPLDTCRPEFYYECDWNGARIIVIVQQTKKMICLKNNNADFASFATRRFSTLINDNLWPSRRCW